MAISGNERDRQALQLRQAGVTYAKIAEALGWKTASAAFKAVERAASRLPEESVEILRAIHRERLNELLFALYALARKGHQGAAKLVLSIMEREAKLVGLDTPVDQKVIIEERVRKELDEALKWMEQDLDAEAYAHVLAILSTRATRS